MNEVPASPAARHGRAGLAAGILALLAVAAAVTAWQWTRPGVQPSPLPSAVSDPRLTYPTPYQNVQPNVKYVGDSACADCHFDIADTYRNHPMGRSLRPVAGPEAGLAATEHPLDRLVPAPFATLLVRAARQEYDRLVSNPYEKFGEEFRVERCDGRVYHYETRRDARGKVIAEARHEVQYEIGSGVHGFSYLSYREGCVFMSPISWYSQKQRWDGSPHFTAPTHFDRAITEQCLFCHSNYFEREEYTINRYKQPLFHGHTIGCERCHGPGELHVQARERGVTVDDLDPTIVNPKRLAPVLRESVCEQCHLEGEVRIVRRGRKAFDFRPGLPLSLFYSVFVNRAEQADETLAVSHVEQMHISRCFTASQGKMSCISCHDPHLLPAPAERVAYYRQRCVKCHMENKNDCSVALAKRQQNGNDCIACHMPPAIARDVVHTAVSDHRILRDPSGGGELPHSIDQVRRPGEPPIVPFYDRASSADENEARHDLGLAMIAMARKYESLAPRISEYALPYMEEAVRNFPDDVSCLEGKGFALAQLGRLEEALQAGHKILERVPAHEQALIWMAEAATGLGRPAEAADYWRRALAINPTSTQYRLEEAKALFKLEDWTGALESARKAARHNPVVTEPRLIIVSSYLRLGQKDKAREELDSVLPLMPNRQAELRHWFAEQQRAVSRK